MKDTPTILSRILIDVDINRFRFYVTFQGKDGKAVNIIDDGDLNSHQIPSFGRFMMDQV